MELDYLFSLRKPDDDQNQRNNKKDVNQPAANMDDKTKNPQNEKYADYCPDHMVGF